MPQALPERVERAWRSLAKADELVQGFGDRGWIASETLAVVEERTHDLARRVGRLEERGVRPDTSPAQLARELDEVTALLIALADAAVVRQPSLAPDEPVPVTLEHAHRHLGATQDLYGRGLPSRADEGGGGSTLAP